ncbi:MAG TPA: hypothetical protein VF144_04775 [Chitinophagaceae bacterium]
MRKIILFAMILSGLMQTASAQKKKDSVNLKNTIHFNITNPLIFNKSFIIGYERVLNPRRSFSINFGTQSFPNTEERNTDSVQGTRVQDRTGFNISADYRFYLAKENKYPAPRGVFIGPYYSFNQFRRNNSWLLKSTNGSSLQVDSKINLNVHTVGFELGYQFVFWDRLAIDMVLIGPGIAAYKFTASFANNLSAADREKLLAAINDALAEKFPGYSWAIDEGEFQKTGTTNSTNIGYRYMVQIGFRF